MIRRNVSAVENAAMAPGGSATHRFATGTFTDHPHRGIETVTYVIEGELQHFDNHGRSGARHPGDAQSMTAGRGVIHNEHVHAVKPLNTLQGLREDT
jgi:redox-sensitive bicupin YhaK (pirin superfamily)